MRWHIPAASLQCMRMRNVTHAHAAQLALGRFVDQSNILLRHICTLSPNKCRFNCDSLAVYVEWLHSRCSPKDCGRRLLVLAPARTPARCFRYRDVFAMAMAFRPPALSLLSCILLSVSRGNATLLPGLNGTFPGNFPCPSLMSLISWCLLQLTCSIGWLWLLYVRID